jgi:hypothetical protein
MHPVFTLHMTTLHLTNWAFIFNLSQMDKRLDIQALRRWPSAFMHRHNSALPAHFRPDSWSGDDQDLASLEDIPSNITLQKSTSRWLQRGIQGHRGLILDGGLYPGRTPGFAMDCIIRANAAALLVIYRIEVINTSFHQDSPEHHVMQLNGNYGRDFLITHSILLVPLSVRFHCPSQ